MGADARLSRFLSPSSDEENLQSGYCSCNEKHPSPAQNHLLTFGAKTGTSPRLKLFRQKVLSGHRLTVLSADKTLFRRSNP